MVFFLACPELVKKKMEHQTFVYDIKPTILVLFFLVGAFLLHLFVILVHICKANPNMKAQYDPGNVWRCGTFCWKRSDQSAVAFRISDRCSEWCR